MKSLISVANVTKNSVSCHRSKAMKKVIHTGEKSYACKFCKKAFIHRCALSRHEKTHKGEKIHCSFCKKTFDHGSCLKRHELIHTGEKPHHCNLCDKKFRQKNRLTEHKKVHIVGDKPYQCTYTKYAFIRNDVKT